MSGKRIATLACLLGIGGCSTAARHSTHRPWPRRTGSADAPYYVEIAAAASQRAAVAPSSSRSRSIRNSQQSFGYTDRAGEFDPLLAALNARLKDRAGLHPGGSRRADGPRPPRVYVGSAESEYAPQDVDDQRMPGDRFAPMVLHLERPGVEWRAAAGALVAQSGVQYAVAIQLGVSEYMKGYSGVFTKEVALGTGYRQPVRFLTAEDKPVEVLHLTGVLVDANGKVVRAGAEGIVLRDTPFLAQAVGATRTFDTQELQRVLTQQRRNDLPGAPLKIDVALDNLIAQLTRSEVRVPAR